MSKERIHRAAVEMECGIEYRSQERGEDRNLSKYLK